VSTREQSSEDDSLVLLKRMCICGKCMWCCYVIFLKLLCRRENGVLIFSVVMWRMVVLRPSKQAIKRASGRNVGGTSYDK